MEDVLDAYARTYDANAPVICMDEKAYQLLEYTRQAIEAKPGRARVDRVRELAPAWRSTTSPGTGHGSTLPRLNPPRFRGNASPGGSRTSMRSTTSLVAGTTSSLRSTTRELAIHNR